MIFAGFKCLGCNGGLMGNAATWLPPRTTPIQTTSSTGTVSVPNAVFVPAAVPTTPSPSPPAWGQMGPTTGGGIITGGVPETGTIAPTPETETPWYKTKLGLVAIAGSLVAGWLLFKR